MDNVDVEVSPSLCIHNKSLHLCPTLCDPMDYSPPGSSVHGTLQARVWSGLPCPPPGDLPNSGIKPRSPIVQADSLLSEPLMLLKNVRYAHWEREERRETWPQHLLLRWQIGRLSEKYCLYSSSHLSHLPLTPQYTVFCLDSGLADKLGSRNIPLNETFFVFTEYGMGCR